MPHADMPQENIPLDLHLFPQVSPRLLPAMCIVVGVLLCGVVAFWRLEGNIMTNVAMRQAVTQEASMASVSTALLMDGEIYRERITVDEVR